MPHTRTDYIEIRNSRVTGEKAYIAGTRISVEDIYICHELQGQTPDQITAAYPNLTLAQVHAALAYYYDHPDEIRQQIRQSEEFVVRMKKKTGPGPLERKLKHTDAQPVEPDAVSS